MGRQTLRRLRLHHLSHRFPPRSDSHVPQQREIPQAPAARRYRAIHNGWLRHPFHFFNGLLTLTGARGLTPGSKPRRARDVRFLNPISISATATRRHATWSRLTSMWFVIAILIPCLPGKFLSFRAIISRKLPNRLSFPGLTNGCGRGFCCASDFVRGIYEFMQTQLEDLCNYEVLAREIPIQLQAAGLSRIAATGRLADKYPSYSASTLHFAGMPLESRGKPQGVFYSTPPRGRMRHPSDLAKWPKFPKETPWQMPPALL